MTWVSLLPVFPSRTYLKLHNISVTLNTLITDLGLSKEFYPDCNPVVVLKSCELELLYIIGELFNMCPDESNFLD